MEVISVEVVREDVHYTCTNEEQLKLFLEAGYVEVKKATTKKKKEAE